jgi:predicted unusual protein kinase regulating ubiquinone biosynthesis (AarF/ABC1/UbiB family)
VYIPKSFPITADDTDNLYVKTEEFISGKTLVRPEELEGHSLPQIVSVIVKNYFKQITEPVKSVPGVADKTISLVHSDVHPGNFMAMKDDNGRKYVAILDRNNYIELNETDRNFLFSFFSSAGHGRARILIDYLNANSNVAFDVSIRKKLESGLEEIFSRPSGFGVLASEASIHINKNGVQVPLKLTLLIKNFNGLEFLCRQAGFTGGIQEALMYSSDK